jgi:four helix bundle protein
VYRAALDFMEWFVRRQGAKEISNRLFRQIDEAGTSVVLNIAEGNGRYAELDHLRFLQIAQSSAVKGAVYLDLGVEGALLAEAEATAGKEMLRRISAMVAGFQTWSDKVNDKVEDEVGDKATVYSGGESDD